MEVDAPSTPVVFGFLVAPEVESEGGPRMTTPRWSREDLREMSIERVCRIVDGTELREMLDRQGNTAGR